MLTIREDLHPKDRGDESERKEEQVDQCQQLDIVSLLDCNLCLLDGFSGLHNTRTREQLVAQTRDLLAPLLVFRNQLVDATHLSSELHSHDSELLLVVLVASRFLLKQRPECTVLPFPDLVGEVVFVCVDHCVHAVDHDAQRLESPEVAPGIGVFVVLEKQFVADVGLEHEGEWRCD